MDTGSSYELLGQQHVMYKPLRLITPNSKMSLDCGNHGSAWHIHVPVLGTFHVCIKYNANIKASW